jgi:hypothetical protein
MLPVASDAHQQHVYNWKHEIVSASNPGTPFNKNEFISVFYLIRPSSTDFYLPVNATAFDTPL